MTANIEDRKCAGWEIFLKEPNILSTILRQAQHSAHFMLVDRQTNIMLIDRQEM